MNECVANNKHDLHFQIEQMQGVVDSSRYMCIAVNKEDGSGVLLHLRCGHRKRSYDHR